MAQAIMLVCDDCGDPAAGTLTLKLNGKTGVKDLCQEHIDGYFDNARKPKRGRKPHTVKAA